MQNPAAGGEQARGCPVVSLSLLVAFAQSMGFVS